MRFKKHLHVVDLLNELSVQLSHLRVLLLEETVLFLKSDKLFLLLLALFVQGKALKLVQVVLGEVRTARDLIISFVRYDVYGRSSVPLKRMWCAVCSIFLNRKCISES